MSNPIDELFRQKLEGHQIAPSADAWERVTAHRNAKKGIALKKWMSIAASLTLIVITIYSINEPGRTIETQEVVKLTTPVEIEPSKEVVMPAVESEGENVGPQQVDKHNILEKTPKKDTKGSVTLMNVAKVEDTTLPQPVAKKGLDTDLKIEMAQIQFEKVEIAAIATSNVPNEKQQNLFDKIADTAKEIKNSDGMMAELRGIKDEMLSLELFKTKKSI